MVVVDDNIDSPCKKNLSSSHGIAIIENEPSSCEVSPTDVVIILIHLMYRMNFTPAYLQQL